MVHSIPDGMEWFIPLAKVFYSSYIMEWNDNLSYNPFLLDFLMIDFF